MEFQRIQEIFAEALKISEPAERKSFVANACGDDLEAQAQIESLLNAQTAAQGFLEMPTLAQEAPQDQETVGQTIGRYKLLENLGEGGWGVVYVAEQQEPIRRRVALKVIKLGMDTKQVIARFEAERQALAMMDHPNIAKVLDAGTTDTGRPYFVMELVRGIKITDYCDQNRLSIRKRLDLFIQVCQAIQHAHQKGIIHRDIKPSNILVTLHDGVPVPKVIDFGIAKATESRLAEATVYTQLHQLIGTPSYMSPEQAEMSGLDIDTRSDIYSLGVLLYELLTGTTPFDTEELLAVGWDEMRRTIREQDPMRPSTRFAELQGEELTTTAKRRAVEVPKLLLLLRGDLDWIVMKSLEQDRTRRYESANGLAEDIERHLADEPITARPPSSAYRLQKYVRRHRLAVTACLVVLITLVLGLIGSTSMYFKAERARSAAETARTRAQEAEKDARENQERAESNQAMAEEQAEATQRASYANAIQLADAKVREGNPSRARELLDSCPEDLRGWEWNRVNHTLDYSSRTLTGHQGQVFAVAVSPDGRRVASGGLDGTLRTWDMSTGKELSIITNAHEGYIYGVAFSPDGHHILSRDWRGEVRLWAETGEDDSPTIVRTEDYGSLVAFSTDGSHVVAASPRKGSITVWDVATEQKMQSIGGKYLEDFVSVAISRDGHLVATGDKEGRITLWDTAKGMRKKRFFDNISGWRDRGF